MSMSQSKLIINLLISFLLIQITIQLQPFITEFIVPFDLPTDDAKLLTSNQLSRNEFRTNTFNTDNVTVSKLIYKSIYNGTNRVVDPKQESFFHTVTNDSIDLIVTYNAVIHTLPISKKSYNGTTKVKVYLNYTKKLVPGDDKTLIEALSVLVDKNSFQMTYSGNPNANERNKLDQINNGIVKKTNILSLLQKQEFTNQIILNFFKENLINQRISPTYDNNYNYSFDKIRINFDMGTAGIQTIDHGIAHYLKAIIKSFNNQIQPLSHAVYEQGYHTLYSLDFINYFLTYNLENNPDWAKYKVNKQTFKSFIFKFKLIDLQFLFQNIVAKYSQFYLNDISIVCTHQKIDNWAINEDQNTLGVDITWGCQGYLDGPTPAALVLDFVASLSYNNQIRLSNDNLDVYLTKTDLSSLQFKTLYDSPLLDAELANFYASEIIQSLKGYMIGTLFKVKPNSMKLALKENVGIYVG